jgi:hypothetical protein
VRLRQIKWCLFVVCNLWIISWIAPHILFGAPFIALMVFLYYRYTHIVGYNNWRVVLFGFLATLSQLSFFNIRYKSIVKFELDIMVFWNVLLLSSFLGLLYLLTEMIRKRGNDEVCK